MRARDGHTICIICEARWRNSGGPQTTRPGVPGHRLADVWGRAGGLWGAAREPKPTDPGSPRDSERDTWGRAGGYRERSSGEPLTRTKTGTGVPGQTRNVGDWGSGWFSSSEWGRSPGAGPASVARGQGGFGPAALSLGVSEGGLPSREAPSAGGERGDLPPLCLAGGSAASECACGGFERSSGLCF